MVMKGNEECSTINTEEKKKVLMQNKNLYQGQGPMSVAVQSTPIEPMLVQTLHAMLAITPFAWTVVPLLECAFSAEMEHLSTVQLLMMRNFA